MVTRLRVFGQLYEKGQAITAIYRISRELLESMEKLPNSI